MYFFHTMLIPDVLTLLSSPVYLPDDFVCFATTFKHLQCNCTTFREIYPMTVCYLLSHLNIYGAFVPFFFPGYLPDDSPFVATSFKHLQCICITFKELFPGYLPEDFACSLAFQNIQEAFFSLPRCSCFGYL
jgi:hypothetical protein